MQPIDLTKIRRFSLIIAIILITYSMAGLALDAPAKIQPLGIPLIIQRPDFLPVGLLLAALYSIIRYIYFGYFVQISCTRARQLLKNGSPVHAPTLGIKLEEFTEQVADEVERYFPSIGKLETKYSTSQTGSQCHVEIQAPMLVWVLSLLEDIDYALPVIANIIAMIAWIIYR